MKKTVLLSFLLLVGIINGFSATIIPGGNVSGTWTLAGSPYNVQGSIMIPDGQTLTIEPGVTINFQGTFKLYMKGRLLAIGTVNDTINFTANDTVLGWRGIRFDNTPLSNDTSKLKFCKITYGRATGVSPDDKGGGLYFSNFSKVIVSNCRISNNSVPMEQGGGIYCFTSSPIITNNTITNNSADNNSGGGIFCLNSNPIIANNVITNNWASQDGGGIYCTGNSSVITISDNIINNNGNWGYGGGICCLSGKAIITNNTVNHNTSYAGGGISCKTSNPISIMGNIISDNFANGSDGGGIYCFGSSSTVISNNIITDNTTHRAVSPNYTGDGGGIYCESCSLFDISNNLISNDTASIQGGGICLYLCSNMTINNDTIKNNSTGYYGGGICMAQSSGSITDNAIHNNAAYIRGGGIYFNINPILISRNKISNNSALYGGGTYGSNCNNSLIINNVFANNKGLVSGGGIYYDSCSSPITNNTIANNSSETGGGLFFTSSSNPSIHNDILWGNTVDSSGAQIYLDDEPSDPEIKYCDIQGGISAIGLNFVFYTGTNQNIIDIVPLFVAPSAGSGLLFNGLIADWSLQNGSLCIDAGNPVGTYPTTDIIGNPRIINNIIDIGAFEHLGNVSNHLITDQISIEIYPNPATTKLNIKGHDNKSIIEIYDISGKLILAQQLNSNQLDITSLTKGLYFLKLTTPEGSVVKKFVKE